MRRPERMPIRKIPRPSAYQVSPVFEYRVKSGPISRTLSRRLSESEGKCSQSISRHNETIAADNFHTAHKKTAGVSPAASREDDSKLTYCAALRGTERGSR